jgi:hypothetical protein
MTYLDLARPLVMESNQSASTVTAIRERPAQLGLVELDRRLAQLVSDTSDVARSVSALDPPAALRAAGDRLRSTMDRRKRAVADLQRGMGLALGDGPADSAVAVLARAGTEMVASDADYAAFVGLLPRSTRRQAHLPRSRWIVSPSVWRPAALADFVAAVRGSQSLQVDHDLVLALVALHPAPIQASPGSQIVPPTTRLTVTALVINVGNQKEHGVPVVATITPQSGASTTTHSTIPINPYQHDAVVLPSLSISPGTNYVLSVSAGPVPGEVNVADNHLDIAVQVRS